METFSQQTNRPNYGPYETLPLMGADARRAHLASVEKPGFTWLEEPQIVEDVVAVGLPVDNIRSLALRNNTRSELARGELKLGSWEVSPRKPGELSVHRANTWLPREAFPGTLTHELAHANSPFDPGNVELYGGEEGLVEAYSFAIGAAGQALATGVYLNGYHRYLANQLAAGEIDQYIFCEETSAIACQLAMTNRQQLRSVEAAQRVAVDRMTAAGRLPLDYEFTRLLSRRFTGNEVELAGADKTLAKLLGIDNYQALDRHIQRVKAHFYSEPNLAKANRRHARPLMPLTNWAGVDLRHAWF